MRAADLLGEHGPLARALAGFELRESQVRMAAMVEDVLEHDGVALVEAGTGTGKTLAYLVPALRSGRKVVVSTGTRTLQDQIMEHDLPALQRHLGISVRAACMKGLTNYVCLRRYRELLSSPESEDPAIARRLPVVREWVARSETGDRAELASIPEEDPIWGAIHSSSETRIGPRCAYFDECFVTAMRERAERAQLVVVNHHLFFADLALRGPHGGGVLPDYDAVIFDEAHRVEDVATLFFGVQVGEPRLETLARDLERASRTCAGLERDRARLLRSLAHATEAFFATLPDPGGEASRVPLLREQLATDRYHALDSALEAVELSCVREAHASEAIAALARRAEQLRAELGRVAEGSREDVVWCAAGPRAGGRRRRAIGASPVDVGAIFREGVLQRVPAVVLTSATLTTGGSFEFVKRRLGIDFEVDEASLPSPFDYARQAALYVPMLPDPRDPAYADAATSEIEALVALTGGGAFVLCTSLRRMSELAGRCRARPVLVQGDAPKNVLLSRFRAAGNAILFATMSFWEGVDVPGDALRLVIVDRLPFDVPSDPLVEARCRRLEEAGEPAFIRYLVPSAALTLKQGFGRLVRTRHDRGVVAILDSRIRSKGYGTLFLRSLPAATRCHSFAEVESFWAKG